MSETGTYRYTPDYTIHPGEILEETLEARNMKKVDLATRCGLSTKTVSQIMSGKAPITPKTAIQLERVLGVSANIWNNLEANFRLFQAKVSEQEQLIKNQDWLEKFPIKQLIKRGLIQRKNEPAEMMQQLLDFFSIGNIAAWEENICQLHVAYRHSPSFSSSPESIATWLRIGELRAEKVDCAPYSKSRFDNALREIRGLTRETPDVFEPRMKQLCARSGVAIVFVAELPETHLSGATRWLATDKALIMLSLRHKSDDHLWFTFFHEAGHIILHGKKSAFLDGEKMESNAEERQADQFASNRLIPEKMYTSFIEKGEYTPPSIQDFAKSLGIAPGIVVGRLQHEDIVPWKSPLNYLKGGFRLVETTD